MAARPTPSPDDELVFLPLGGSGEIGMNLNLYGYGPADDRQWIIVDLGVTFADQRTPGIDLIMADPDYIVQRKDNILGLVLTHGHEDHIGAVASLWSMLECPIFATPFTAELVRGKLNDANFHRDPDITIVPLGGRITLGPFEIEFVTLTHSIPESNALAIETPLGRVLHTGDWKLDPDPLIGELSDESYLREFGEKGVTAMVCDSTNVFVPGHAGSEADVRDSLIELIGELNGAVIVTCFASNVARLESIAHVARIHDRQLCLVGRSMHRMVDAARSVGLLQDFPTILSDKDAGFLPRDKVLYLCTGSQAEPRAALSRIVDGNNPHIFLEEGDTVVFSSRIIPGNEVPIYELQNRLADLGVRIITEKDHFVHVSGHPCRDELTKMYQWVRPQIAIPVHGEARHLLEHGELARELQIPQSIVPRNGSMIRLAPGNAQIIDQVPVGRLYLDGRMLVNEDDSHLRDRRKISYVGYVGVTIVIDQDGKLLADPVVRLQGIPEQPLPGGHNLKSIIENEILDVLEHLPTRKRKKGVELKDELKRAARRPLLAIWGKRPVVDVSVIRV